jgi:hypothetical protein
MISTPYLRISLSSSDAKTLKRTLLTVQGGFTMEFDEKVKVPKTGQSKQLPKGDLGSWLFGG